MPAGRYCNHILFQNTSTLQNIKPCIDITAYKNIKIYISMLLTYRSVITLDICVYTATSSKSIYFVQPQLLPGKGDYYAPSTFMDPTITSPQELVGILGHFLEKGLLSCSRKSRVSHTLKGICDSGVHSHLVICHSFTTMVLELRFTTYFFIK